MSSGSSNPFGSFTDTINSGTNVITNTTNNIKEQYGDYFTNNYIYIGLVGVVIICVIVGWLLYRIITTKLFLNIKEVSEDTKVPIIGTEKKTFTFDYEPTGNGERRSYSFWIYIHDMNKYPNQYKKVLSMSDGENTNIDKLSPLVFLDKTQNRMYVRFSTKIDNQRNNTDDFSSISESNLAQKMIKGIVVPYIPLQRWVHIAIVCNANSYKNYIYAYVDGDLVNTTSSGEIDKYINAGTQVKKDLNNMNINISGKLVIGGTINDYTGGNGFSGLVSKFTTYNYELNQKDVFDDYYSGPIGGFMASLGLGMYGIRSPIYKI